MMKKKLLIYSIAITIIVCGMFIVFIRIGPRLHDKICYIKEQRRLAKEQAFMNEKKCDISSLSPLKDELEAWYTKYHVISHGGGGIDGKVYTNSLEAWNLSYERGNRIIDADLRFTSDSVLVLRHSWSDNLELSGHLMKNSYKMLDKNGHMQYKIDYDTLDYKSFISSTIYHLYTPMSCQDMLLYMHTHPDLYVAADIKDDIEITYKYIVDQANKLDVDDVLKRIIVSVYKYDDIKKVMGIYKFSEVTLRQHYVHPNNWTELIDFCVRHNIHTVNISSCYAESGGVKLMKEKGIHVYVAVCDYISDMRYYRKLGIDGCVSNFLYEDVFHLTKP